MSLQFVLVEYIGLYSRRVRVVLWDVTAGWDLMRSLHVDPTVGIRCDASPSLFLTYK